MASLSSTKKRGFEEMIQGEPESNFSVGLAEMISMPAQTPAIDPPFLFDIDASHFASTEMPSSPFSSPMILTVAPKSTPAQVPTTAGEIPMLSMSESNGAGTAVRPSPLLSLQPSTNLASLSSTPSFKTFVPAMTYPTPSKRPRLDQTESHINAAPPQSMMAQPSYFSTNTSRRRLTPPNPFTKQTRPSWNWLGEKYDNKLNPPLSQFRKQTGFDFALPAFPAIVMEQEEFEEMKKKIIADNQIASNANRQTYQLVKTTQKGNIVLPMCLPVEAIFDYQPVPAQVQSTGPCRTITTSVESPEFLQLMGLSENEASDHYAAIEYVRSLKAAQNFGTQVVAPLDPAVEGNTPAKPILLEDDDDAVPHSDAPPLPADPPLSDVALDAMTARALDWSRDLPYLDPKLGDLDCLFWPSAAPSSPVSSTNITNHPNLEQALQANQMHEQSVQQRVHTISPTTSRSTSPIVPAAVPVSATTTATPSLTIDTDTDTFSNFTTASILPTPTSATIDTQATTSNLLSTDPVSSSASATNVLPTQFPLDSEKIFAEELAAISTMELNYTYDEFTMFDDA